VVLLFGIVARFLCPILSQVTAEILARLRTHYENLIFGSQTDRSLYSALTNLDDRGSVIFLHLIDAEALLRQLALRISSMLMLILILPQIILRRNFPPLSRSCDTTIANTLDLSEYNMLPLTHYLL